MKQYHHYLVRLQYLGFRYHGWQKQKDVKTVQSMFDRTLNFILEEICEFKTLASGRTDAMVSCEDAAVLVLTRSAIDKDWLLEQLHGHLPADIRAKSITDHDAKVNIINSSKQKKYHYYFCYGDKPHPFSAPFMTHIKEQLDIELMNKGAKLYIGKHNFKNYIYQPNPRKQLERVVLSSQIEKNDIYTANFFPKNSFVYKVKGPGFGRHQVRLMMGQLFLLGMSQITLQELADSLVNTNELAHDQKMLAPASGLILHSVEFQ